MRRITQNLTTFIFYFVKQYRWYFAAMTGCRVVSVVLDNLVLPYVFKGLVSRLSGLSANRSAIWLKLGSPFLVLLLVILLIDLCYRLSDYLKVHTIPKFEANVRMWMVRYLQGHSYQFFTENFSGDLVKRVDDLTDGVSQIVMMLITSFLPILCTMLAGMLSFSGMQPIFGFLLMIWLLGYIVAYWVFAKSFAYKAVVHAEKVSLLSGSMVDGFTNILSMKLFVRDAHAMMHLTAPQEAEKQAHKEVLRAIMYLHFVIGALSIGFMVLGLLCPMIYYWQLDQLSIAELIYIFTTGTNICNLVWSAVTDFPDLFEEGGYCTQALKLLQHQHAVLDLPSAAVLHCSCPDIEYKDVSFAYTNHSLLFENQNVYIASGAKVGLVGLSGSGKSTFAYLLLRFFNLQKGVIAIGGQDIARVTQESLRAAIALIPQDTILFHASILENIRYGRKDATDQEIIAVAKELKCHDFIMRLPEGYHTLVGERGSKLSGGQRQRIAIVRAMLKNAPILILDEATSALDAVTEAEIQESLSIAMAGKTTIVIAHRLAVLAAMDQILVFDQGRIVAQGSHDLLLRTNAFYAAICRLHCLKA